MQENYLLPELIDGQYQRINTFDSSVSFVGINNSMLYCCKTIQYDTSYVMHLEHVVLTLN